MSSRISNQLTKQDLLVLFEKVDRLLASQQAPPTTVVILGAASILLLDVRERATYDIDVAPVHDALRFKQIMEELGVPVDLVTVTTTVDFEKGGRYPVFTGKKLSVVSVDENDLIKLKLERFRKQDPDDIQAIIAKFEIDFERYREIAISAAQNFVGNRRMMDLAILEMAADNYHSKQVERLEADLKKIL